jgi:hypothetical protein
MQCKYEKNTIQCSNMAEQNQKYCKEHLATKKAEIAQTAILGMAMGALFANPIGIVLGGLFGGVIGNALHKHKKDELENKQ